MEGRVCCGRVCLPWEASPPLVLRDRALLQLPRDGAQHLAGVVGEVQVPDLRRGHRHDGERLLVLLHGRGADLQHRAVSAAASGTRPPEGRHHTPRLRDTGPLTERGLPCRRNQLDRQHPRPLHCYPWSLVLRGREGREGGPLADSFMCCREHGRPDPTRVTSSRARRSLLAPSHMSQGWARHPAPNSPTPRNVHKSRGKMQERPPKMVHMASQF